jgi:hypothetical protein
MTEHQIVVKGELMPPTEIPVEDWEECSKLELDEMEAQELFAEEEEREYARERLELQSSGLPARESEFNDSEEEEYLPD